MRWFKKGEPPRLLAVSPEEAPSGSARNAIGKMFRSFNILKVSIIKNLKLRVTDGNNW